MYSKQSIEIWYRYTALYIEYVNFVWCNRSADACKTCNYLYGIFAKVRKSYYADSFKNKFSLENLDKIHTRTRSCRKMVGLLSRCVTTLVPMTFPKYALLSADNALEKPNKPQ